MFLQTTPLVILSSLPCWALCALRISPWISSMFEVSQWSPSSFVPLKLQEKSAQQHYLHRLPPHSIHPPSNFHLSGLLEISCLLWRQILLKYPNLCWWNSPVDPLTLFVPLLQINMLPSSLSKPNQFDFCFSSVVFFWTQEPEPWTKGVINGTIVSKFICVFAFTPACSHALFWKL